MQISLTFHSNLDQKDGKSEEIYMDVPAHCTVEDLRFLAHIDLYRMLIINGKRAEKDLCIKEGDKIKVLPYLFGG